ncbi:hypothetical protein BJV78DRAFT_1277632 [Lactifluus subvellereus]|nr:hypothetical protein BJV78DRAFT_1277632 [Lactifluus subvellereus]
MPRYSPKVSNPTVTRLTEVLTKYYFLTETCAQCVRPLPNKSQLYAEAVNKWKTRHECYRPRRGDETAKAAFLTAVDAVCDIQSRTPEDCYLIIFACSAGLQFSMDGDYVTLTDAERIQVMVDSQRISMQQVKEYMAKHQSPASKEKVDNLIGTHFRYCTGSDSSDIKECFVGDYLTSHHLKDSYYVVSYKDGGEEAMVSESEMEEMLKNRQHSQKARHSHRGLEACTR